MLISYKMWLAGLAALIAFSAATVAHAQPTPCADANQTRVALGIEPFTSEYCAMIDGSAQMSAKIFRGRKDNDK